MYDLFEEEIIMNCIYITREKLEGPAYVYVRFIKGEEVGFSVLDDLCIRPDYSQCGVFWVKQADFLKMFKPYETDGVDS